MRMANLNNNSEPVNFFYIRYYGERGRYTTERNKINSDYRHPIACIAYKYLPNNKISYQISICNFSAGDRFLKKKGRDFAETQLKNNPILIDGPEHTKEGEVSEREIKSFMWHCVRGKVLKDLCNKKDLPKRVLEQIKNMRAIADY